MTERTHDIFLSYRNDGTGQNFAARLDQDLTDAGYSVYFNPNEQGASDFPDRLRSAVTHCTDFVAIVTPEYLERLFANEKEQNWIQKEVLTAHASTCKITPLLVNGAKMPSDLSKLPENLQFFARIDAITMPDSYKATPFADLIHKIRSRPDKDDLYKHVDNSNPSYQVKPELKSVSAAAQEGNPQAIMRTALMYYYGFDGKRDYGKAETLLRELADGTAKEADPDLTAAAENLLARMYYSGQIAHENQSYEKSFDYHARAAERNRNSRAELSFAKRVGVGCPFDYNAMEELYRQAAAMDSDSLSHWGLGSFYETYGKFKEAAEQYQAILHTSREAAYRLGLMYKKGVLTDPPCPDYSAAANLLKPLAMGAYPHTEAAYELGMCFARPTGSFPQSFVEAAVYFRIAAEKGHTEAAYMLGWICENELAGPDPHSKADALRYYETAAANGHALAALQLAQLYQEKSDFTNYHKAYRYAVTAANGGAAEAELILGNLLLLGRGCEPDENCAYRHYVRAAEKGIYAAEEMMKVIDEKIINRGKAAEQVEIADHLYDSASEDDWKKAAEILNHYCDSNGKAANLLGLMYHHGRGVDQNEEKAIQLYRRAAELEYRKAYSNLACDYFFGLRVEKDFKESAYWCKKSADTPDDNGEGDHDSELVYGRMLRLGLGIPKDLEQAIGYLKRASRKYTPMACYECALCYEEEQDYKNALYWFTRAAERYVTEGAVKTAIYYRDGLGMDKPDPAEAEKWFEIARQSGWTGSSDKSEEK